MYMQYCNCKLSYFYILVAQQVRMEKNWIDSLFAHLKLIQFDCVYFLIGTAFNSADSAEYC